MVTNLSVAAFCRLSLCHKRCLYLAAFTTEGAQAATIKSSDKATDRLVCYRDDYELLFIK